MSNGPDLTKISPPTTSSGPDLSRVVPPTQPGYAEDIAKAGAAGVARGTASLLDLPGSVMGMFGRGAEKALTALGASPEFAQATRESLTDAMPWGSGDTYQSATSDLTGGGSEYRGKTTPGRYAGTIGEFVPGALIPAGEMGLGTRLVTQAIAPGIGSEAAGQLSENYLDPKYEPWARLAGSVVGGVLGTKGMEAARRVVTPVADIPPADIDQAVNYLESKNIPVRAGQSTMSQAVTNMEAGTKAASAFQSDQERAFTRAAMNMIGSNSDVATPQAISEAYNGISNDFSRALSGVAVQVDDDFVNGLADAAKNYKISAPRIEITGLPDDIVKTAINARKSGTPIPADALAKWRSALGDMLQSGNPAVRENAYAMRDVIDNAIENSMVAMGEPWRKQLWDDARLRYRNYLSIIGSIRTNKDSALRGVLTPSDLMASLVRKDRGAVLRGQRGDIADLATAGQLVLKPVPAQPHLSVFERATQALGPIGQIGGAVGVMQAANYAGISPVVQALVAAGYGLKEAQAIAMQALRNRSMQPWMQAYLKNRLMTGSVPYSIPSISGLATAADRPERKAGGRVGTNHEDAADRLVNAAERAKKEISRGTESLLDTPDDHVAAALEIANRSI